MNQKEALGSANRFAKLLGWHPVEIDDRFIPDPATLAVIDNMVAKYPDVRVSAGCIKGGKIRPNQTYARLALARQFWPEVPPRKLAPAFGVGVDYLTYAVRRGRAILQDDDDSEGDWSPSPDLA